MVYPRSFVIALAASCSVNVLGQYIQKPGLQVPSNYSSNRDAAKKLFTTSYDAYKKYAWGHDDLQPISKTFNDGRNGWGASIVDAMSTMYIMGLMDDFKAAVNFTSSIDFSKSQTSDAVSVFETTIRYVAGFLSAYELSGQKYPILVEKAKEVADKMAFAWVGSNPIPYNEIDFTTNQPISDTTNIAQAGTLTLEFGTLSKHTRNDTYRQLAEKSAQAIMNAPAPLPALPGQVITAQGVPADAYVTWGGGSDSYFEYLIKYPRLTGNIDDDAYVTTWATAVDSSIKDLIRTSTVGNWTYLADYDSSKQIRHVGSHLACFYGGNWLMGGKLLNNQTIIDYGLKLTDACWNTYYSTLTKIGPEVFAYASSDGSYTGGTAPSAGQLAFYAQHGFYIVDGASDYILRPEVLESNFYAWRVTGNTKYLDNAVSAIKSFNTFLPATVAFAGISDVNSITSDKYDDMESFWFAEVLKYLYLTFDDPNHISLDEWVFNTECHPFKAPAAQNYTVGTYKPSQKPFAVITGNIPTISPQSSLTHLSLPTLNDILHI